MSGNTRIDWRTPFKLFKQLDREFNFTLDPCSVDSNRLSKNFDWLDSIVCDWSNETVFMNPPYTRNIGKWLRKAWMESKKGAVVVALVPSKTDTKWWHDYVLKASEIRFVKGRIEFRTGDGEKIDRAPFPNSIVIFRPESDGIKTCSYIMEP